MKPSGIGDQEMDSPAPPGGASTAADVGAAVRAPALAPRSESAVVRTAQSDIVPAVSKSQPPPLTYRPASVSRVVSVGAGVAAREAGAESVASWRFREGSLGGGSGEDDAVTTVDGAYEPLSEEQRAALARRVHSELERTKRLGTPAPAPVASGVARSGRAPTHPFKHTIMLGAPLPPSRRSELPAAAALVPPAAAPPSSPASASPPSSPASAPSSATPSTLRASFVRTVGLPTSPPPRRSRRSGLPMPESSSGDAGSEAPQSEPEHEAFQLDRRSNPGMTLSLAVAHVTPPFRAAPGASLMLPPPPGAADYEPASPSTFPPVSVSPVSVSPVSMPPPLQHSTMLSRPRLVEPLGELPSVDPFAGFVARPPSFLERWLVVLVVALALVGAAALAAIALGYLGKPGG